MERNKHTERVTDKLLLVFKIASPVLASVFILISCLIYQKGVKEGSAELLADEKYLPRFVSDVASAKTSIYCAMYMFKFDAYLKNNLQEPTPLLAAALVDAAKRGVEVAMIFDKGRNDNDSTTKYNKVTADFLTKNGVKVIFDTPEKSLHSKMCLIDEKILFIGSHNYTFSAMSRNSETSVRIVSKDLANDAMNYFKSLGL